MGMQGHKSVKYPRYSVSVLSCPTINSRNIISPTKLKCALGRCNVTKKFQNIVEGTKSFEVPSLTTISSATFSLELAQYIYLNENSNIFNVVSNGLSEVYWFLQMGKKCTAPEKNNSYDPRFFV